LANQSSKPKRPTFVHWLRASGQISDEDLRLLSNEWNQIKPSGFKVYTTGPITWDQFVASKYPRKVLAFQAYLRVIGAAPTFKKD
jgi:hypothetical protein